MDEPRRYVDPFIAGLTAHAPSVRAAVAARGRALPGAAAALAALCSAGTLRRSGARHQSVLTGNIRPVAEVKLGRARAGTASTCASAPTATTTRCAPSSSGSRGGGPRPCTAGRPRTSRAAATVVIGDTPLDIEAALATGARAVGVATGPFPAADLRAAGAHAVLPDLTDTDLVLRALLSLCRRRVARPAAGRLAAGGPSGARQAGEQGLS